MAKFKTLGLPPAKLKKFAKEFYSIVDDAEGKDQYDKLMLTIELFKKYNLLKTI